MLLLLRPTLHHTVPIWWLQPVLFYLYWYIVWIALLLLHRCFLWRWSISLQPLKWICSEGLWQGPWNWWRRRPLSRGRLIKMTCCSVTFPAQRSQSHWQCRHTTQDWTRVEATKVEQQPSWRRRFWECLTESKVRCSPVQWFIGKLAPLVFVKYLKSLAGAAQQAANNTTSESICRCCDTVNHTSPRLVQCHSFVLPTLCGTSWRLLFYIQ